MLLIVGSLLLVHPRMVGGKQLSFSRTFYVRPACVHSIGFSRLQETCVRRPSSRCALCMKCHFTLDYKSHSPFTATSPTCMTDFYCAEAFSSPLNILSRQFHFTCIRG